MRQKGGSHFCKLSANGIILFLIQDSPTKPKYFNERFYYKEISNIFIIFNLLNNSFIMNQSVSEHRDETSDWDESQIYVCMSVCLCVYMYLLIYVLYIIYICMSVCVYVDSQIQVSWKLGHLCTYLILTYKLHTHGNTCT